LTLPPGLREQFAEMFMILKAINAHNLQPALAWSKRNRSLLAKNDSLLEFRLHQLQFLLLLLDDQQQLKQSARERTLNALAYAKKEFGIFGRRHIKEIQKLMGCICYTSELPFTTVTKTVDGPSSTTAAATNPLLSSPYAEMFTGNMWSEIEDLFAREFCSLLGLAQESPLTVTASVGASAIPTMIKLRNVLEKRQTGRTKVEMWSAENELPVSCFYFLFFFLFFFFFLSVCLLDWI
jgi:E3 ubiquitin-protein transferase RMND5